MVLGILPASWWLVQVLKDTLLPLRSSILVGISEISEFVISPIVHYGRRIVQQGNVNIISFLKGRGPFRTSLL